jgi:hypothetical protein
MKGKGGQFWILHADVEFALAGGQIERRELTTAAGLPEDGSHDEASIAQRRVQASSR